MAAATAPTLTTRQLNRATLARQLLLAREPLDVVAAVERLGGLQAQLAWPPYAALWSRLAGSDGAGFARGDLVRALAARTLVRATFWRGTLHVVSARDYLGLRAAIQPMLTRGLQSTLRERLKDVDIAATAAAARRFFDEEPRTYDELRDHFRDRQPGSDERALAYAARLTLPAVLVPDDSTWAFAPAADVATAATWLGAEPAASTDLEALVLRYLAAYGPATPADAQTWSGLTGLKPVFEALRPRLAVFRDEQKREVFDLPDAPRPPADSAAPVRLLPDFDSLVLAYADRIRLIDDEHRGRVTLKNLQVRATFLVDGRVAGTWSLTRKRTRARLELQPFAALPKAARAALGDEAERMSRFVEEDAADHEVAIADASG